MLCTCGPSVAVTIFLFLVQNLYYNTDLVGITRLLATRSRSLALSLSISRRIWGFPLDNRALRDNADAGDTSGHHITPPRHYGQPHLVSLN
jgi:hypothetical protein